MAGENSHHFAFNKQIKENRKNSSSFEVCVCVSANKSFILIIFICSVCVLPLLYFRAKGICRHFMCDIFSSFTHIAYPNKLNLYSRLLVLGMFK